MNHQDCQSNVATKGIKMNKGRLEAFSDGVIAVIITIMVLELKPPQGSSFHDTVSMFPSIFGYILSFIFIGIYWNNHHHLFQAAKKVNGRILWANLHLLFWLSLVPFATSWMDEEHYSAWPVAVYGIVLLASAIAFTILSRNLIHHHGKDSLLAQALGNGFKEDLKGLISLVFYTAAIPAAFLNTWISRALYIAVAIIWLLPDTRIEKRMDSRNNENPD